MAHIDTVPKPKLVHVIANPASAHCGTLLNTLNRQLREADIQWDFRVTHGIGDGEKLAKEAVEAGAEAVASFGGDGTVMDVASGLVGTEVPLLILPGGTGNLVAAELHLPRELDKVLGKICRGEVSVRSIDLGKMDDRYFLMRVGCGFETEVVADASRELKNQFGKWAYVFAAAKALQEVQPADYTLHLDDKETFKGSGVACFVANAGLVGIGDMALSPNIDLDDGKLDVIFLKKADVEGIFSLVRMMVGEKPSRVEEADDEETLDASHLVQHWQVKKVRIETDPPLDMQADGDLWGKTPQNIEVLHKAFKVVV